MCKNLVVISKKVKRKEQNINNEYVKKKINLLSNYFMTFKLHLFHLMRELDRQIIKNQNFFLPIQNTKFYWIILVVRIFFENNLFVSNFFKRFI